MDFFFTFSNIWHNIGFEILWDFLFVHVPFAVNQTIKNKNVYFYSTQIYRRCKSGFPRFTILSATTWIWRRYLLHIGSRKRTNTTTKEPSVVWFQICEVRFFKEMRRMPSDLRFRSASIFWICNCFYVCEFIYNQFIPLLFDFFLKKNSPFRCLRKRKKIHRWWLPPTSVLVVVAADADGVGVRRNSFDSISLSEKLKQC
jgi:hypothetical protein